MRYLFQDYKQLDYHYETPTALYNAIAQHFSVYEHVLYETPLNMSSYEDFVKGLCVAIFGYYRRDKIAFVDKDLFAERMAWVIAENVGRYFQKQNIQFFIEKNTETGKYTLTTKMSSNSNEKGVSGSSVLQSSASTPTGVAPTQTGGTITITSTGSQGEEQATFTNNGYTDKYTNFQGKTNGLHKNDVAREGDVTREGNYLQAIELFEKLPRSFIDDVLRDVSTNFIFIYN